MTSTCFRRSGEPLVLELELELGLELKLELVACRRGDVAAREARQGKARH